MEEGDQNLQGEAKASQPDKVHFFKELPSVLRVLVFSACIMFILAIITGCIEYTFFLYCNGFWWNISHYMPRHEVGKAVLYPYTIIWILSLFGLGIFVLDFFAGLVCVALGKLRSGVYVTWTFIQLLLFLVIAWVILCGWRGIFE